MGHTKGRAAWHRRGAGPSAPHIKHVPRLGLAKPAVKHVKHVDHLRLADVLRQQRKGGGHAGEAGG